MGGVSSSIESGVQRATCCVQRRPAARCFNSHLNGYLVKLEYSGAMVEEVWLVEESSDNAESKEPFGGPHRAIVYNINAKRSGRQVLSSLRLDWRPDGLSFMEGCLTKDCISFKVPTVPISLQCLIEHLHSLEKQVYDISSFNSQDFCRRLFDEIDGREESGRKKPN
eukprot:TRINITY_DN66475_c0_g1_i1.p1 TRINITY_DN66475_c0_g1~~TRINITY_DN66475_c0_g1_i1.p1  ORF type:complete len:167 (-),score=26.95 TRINITY_DN66475_c0_g1_i1:106-606(-)